MKRFIFESEPDNDNIVRLSGQDYHYLVHVRRLAVGESFPAFLPDGTETLVNITSIDKNILTGKCNSLSSSAPHSPLPTPIILFQALPKSDKMDLIVRQAAEGGVAEIVPFTSEFSIGRANVGEQKFARWEKIIKEARQQSGSSINTFLHKPVTINELFEYWNELKKRDAIGLLFHHKNFSSKNFSSRGLEKNSLHGYLSSRFNVVVLAIGPEGGFSDREVSLFMENEFKPITIGDTILRTETAALYCAAAVRVLLLERDSWQYNQTKTNSV